jgi:hypothetical protein
MLKSSIFYTQDEYMRADVFYITQALPKYLNRWRSFAETAGRKREIVESAASFRRYMLLVYLTKPNFSDFHTLVK